MVLADTLSRVAAADSVRTQPRPAAAMPTAPCKVPIFPDPARRPPTPRRQIRRAKTGCGTCKARRVKCDEQQPCCARCISAGRACAGYGIWGGGGGGAYATATPRLGTRPPVHPGPVGRLSPQDGRILDWTTGAKFEGVFPFPFWETLVPQACHSDPAILNSVLALGSIHRRACIERDPSSSRETVVGLEATALQYYNLAIGSLTSIRHPCGDKADTRVTLAACLIFIMIEYLQGRQAQGLRHLRHGLRILRSREDSRLSTDMVDDWIAEAFERLEIQTRPLLNTVAECRGTRVKKEGVVLNSLREARQSLDRLMADAYELQSRGHSAWASADTSVLLDALSLQQQLQHDLDSWIRAYRVWEATWPADAKSQSVSEQAARQLLVVYHTMMTVMAATALQAGDESVFDHHTAQFASIVAASMDIVRLYKPRLSLKPPKDAYCTRHFTFVSDLGLITVLYYTATKCRDPDIRRDALSLMLASTCQEGIWQASTSALVIGELIRLEAPDSQLDAGSALSASRRVFDLAVAFPDNPTEDLVLNCKRTLDNGTWEVVQRTRSGGKWH